MSYFIETIKEGLRSRMEQAGQEKRLLRAVSAMLRREEVSVSRPSLRHICSWMTRRTSRDKRVGSILVVQKDRHMDANFSEMNTKPIANRAEPVTTLSR